MFSADLWSCHAFHECLNYLLFHFCQPTFTESNVPEKNHDLMPKDTASSEAPDRFVQSKDLDSNAEYIRRIANLESRIRILKQQVIVAMEQAEKSSMLSKSVSLLENPVSALKSKIAQLEDGDKYMTEILERACEQLKCKFLGALEYFFTQVYADIVTLDACSCLDAAAEDL
jgi:hypothetical protein